MFFLNSVSLKEKVDFTKNLGVMLKSGITINEALEILGDQTNNRAFKKSINKIRENTERGTPLSESFLKEKKSFGGVFVSLIRAGEVSGTLEENLVFLSDWLERNSDLKQEINTATLYPKFVLAATFILGGGLSIYILPKLIPLFSQLRVELPITTKILMAFSIFMQNYWFFVLIGVAAFWFTFSLLNRVRLVRKFLHGLYINSPFVGSLIIDYQLALISQLFLTLFKGGLSIDESLEITGKAIANIRYQESIERIRGRVNKGTALSEAIKEYPKLYPVNFFSIISTAEKSGTLDESLKYLSQFYSKEVKNKVKKLPTIIEPILLIFIAFVVGFIALSIISPIYELTRGVSR
ncbi:type II secretion system F family protein [Patescibacteria group bacterium]